MRLTKQMRADFVTLVMNDIPWKNKWDKKACEEEITRRFHDALPDELKEVKKKWPRALDMGLTYINFLKYLDLNTGCTFYYGYAQRCSIQELSDIKIDDIEANFNAWLAEYEQRHEMAKRLREVADSCPSTQALAAALPDLVDYMPAESTVQKTKNLPVAAGSLYNDLKAMGLNVREAK